MSIALIAAKQFSRAPTLSVIEKHKVVFKVSLLELEGAVVNIIQFCRRRRRKEEQLLSIYVSKVKKKKITLIYHGLVIMNKLKKNYHFPLFPFYNKSKSCLNIDLIKKYMFILR